MTAGATSTVPPERKRRLAVPTWLKKAVAWFVSWVRTRWATAMDATQPTGRRWRAAVIGVAGIGAAAGAMGSLVLLLYAAVLLPFTPGVSALRHARELHPAIILSSDGEELTRLARNDREWVELDDVAPSVIDALLATEDRRFYDHGGVDLRRLVGAVLRTLSGDRQGGSTITQQLARNLFPDRIGAERSLTRKLKELLTALKIESVYSKDEILEIYLNTVPFLYNAFGIERAAHTYFGRSAADLTVLQSATLVGMLKGTSYYNPVRNPERARERRNLVLSLMVDQGHLDAGEAQRLREEPLGLDFERPRPRRSRASHFTEFVRRWLVEWADEHGYNAYGDGLVVHTTLDMGLQREASRAVVRWGDALQAVADVEWGRTSGSRLGTTTAPYEGRQRGVEPFSHFWESRSATVDAFVRESEEYRALVAAGAAPEAALDSLRSDEAFMDALRDTKTRLDVGFVAIDPETGAIRAWIGSRNFSRTPFDHVADARRQPGSTFKPFVYGRALEEGWSDEDTLSDGPYELALENGEIWRPANADGTAGEPVTLREGLTRSRNTVTARLIDAVGARDVARFARRLGVNRSRLRPVPSLALGTSEVSLLEMASSYATVAGGGVYRRPFWVTRIEDRDGNVLAEFAPTERRAVAPDADLMLLDMMRDVIDEGTGRGVRSRFGLRGDLAGKTGTSQDGADGWFLLMHPELVAGAWVGFDDPRVTFRSSYWGEGAHNALLVVGGFAQGAVRRGLLDTNARFPEAPEEIQPGLGRRALDWLRDLFDIRLERVPESEDQEPDIYNYPDADYPDEDYDPFPEPPDPPWIPDPGPAGEDAEDFDAVARRVLEEARRRAEEATEEFMEDPPITSEDFDELSRRAEELARELEALEAERAAERDPEQDGGLKD
jgi:penicillin-binding protein 1A